MKRITILSVLVLTFASLTMSAQKETRDHRDFNKVGFAVSGDLFLKTGPSYSVVLEGDKDLLEDIITETRDNKLIIRHKSTFWSGTQKVMVYITMPDVEGLSIAGSGSIHVESPLKGEELKLAISGSGKIFAGDIAYSSLDCSIAGSGNFEFSGSGAVTTADLSISGSGNFNAPDLNITDLDARIAGSGSCDCHVTGSLNASIAGSGDVYYSGNPKINIKSAGSGKVRSK